MITPELFSHHTRTDFHYMGRNFQLCRTDKGGIVPNGTTMSLDCTPDPYEITIELTQGL